MEDQLERAHESLQETRGAGKPVLLLVHTGGNDVLHTLLIPPLLLLLVLDIVRLALVRAGLSRLASPPPPWFSFTSLVVRRYRAYVLPLLAAAEAKGHEGVAVLGIPINSAIPLARLLIGLLTLGASVDSTLASL